MSAMAGRSVYKSVEPELFRNIEHACSKLKYSKLKPKVITERHFRERLSEVPG